MTTAHSTYAEFVTATVARILQTCAQHKYKPRADGRAAYENVCYAAGDTLSAVCYEAQEALVTDTERAVHSDIARALTEATDAGPWAVAATWEGVVRAQIEAVRAAIAGALLFGKQQTLDCDA